MKTNEEIKQKAIEEFNLREDFRKNKSEKMREFHMFAYFSEAVFMSKSEEKENQFIYDLGGFKLIVVQEGKREDSWHTFSCYIEINEEDNIRHIEIKNMADFGEFLINRTNAV